MSMAILAKTAKERATIAIRIMKHNKDPFTRELDNCFEMGDGEEVIRIVKERAKRDPALMVRVLKVFASHVIADLGGPSHEI